MEFKSKYLITSQASFLDLHVRACHRHNDIGKETIDRQQTKNIHVMIHYKFLAPNINREL